MKRWNNIWPFLGAILLFIFNVDWVVAFFLNSFNLSFWNKFLILAPLANLELVGWYLFWRWFFKSFIPERKNIKETINFTKEVAQELKMRGYVDRIVEHFEKTFEWAVNPNQYLFKVVKAWGHLGMLFLGVEPFVSGGRIVGVIFCATTGWKNGMVSLIIGNTAHVLITIGSWNLFFYLWDTYRTQLIIGTVVAILFFARGFIWRKLSGGQEPPKSP